MSITRIHRDEPVILRLSSDAGGPTPVGRVRPVLAAIARLVAERAQRLMAFRHYLGGTALGKVVITFAPNHDAPNHERT